MNYKMHKARLSSQTISEILSFRSENPITHIFISASNFNNVNTHAFFDYVYYTPIIDRSIHIWWRSTLNFTRRNRCLLKISWRISQITLNYGDVTDHHANVEATYIIILYSNYRRCDQIRFDYVKYGGREADVIHQTIFYSKTFEWRFGGERLSK